MSQNLSKRVAARIRGGTCALNSAQCRRPRACRWARASEMSDHPEHAFSLLCSHARLADAEPPNLSRPSLGAKHWPEGRDAPPATVMPPLDDRDKEKNEDGATRGR